MSNDNNTPKTASHMLYHELAANGGTKRDIVDRLMLKPPLHSLTNADLCEAAQEIRDLRETVNDLTAWAEGVEADNDSLRKEIARLKEERDDAFKQIDELQDVCGDSADCMVKLRKERDSARWEVCELSGNGSIDSASRVAKERGWDLTEEDTGEANANNNLFRSTDMS